MATSIAQLEPDALYIIVSRWMCQSDEGWEMELEWDVAIQRPREELSTLDVSSTNTVWEPVGEYEVLEHAILLFKVGEASPGTAYDDLMLAFKAAVHHRLVPPGATDEQREECLDDLLEDGGRLTVVSVLKFLMRHHTTIPEGELDEDWEQRELDEAVQEAVHPARLEREECLSRQWSHRLGR